MRKKRILWVGEASFLSTGFSTYAREILNRLHNTNKYEICELGCYASDGDQRRATIPWNFVGNLPKNEEENKAYTSDPGFQFGSWKFDDLVLQFKPDVVCDIRDHWMLAYEAHSPLRRFYSLAWMPTVDAEPQNEQWIADYTLADAVLTYSDWGLEVLKKQSNGKIKCIKSAPAGANFKDYYIVASKKTHKVRFGFPEDSFIVGTIMRNQKRKQYPDLMYAFSKLLEGLPLEEKNKTFLYLHTTYPDTGWNIPYYINEFGINNNILMTYVCGNCKSLCVMRYCDSRNQCDRCGFQWMTFPNSQNGVPSDILGEIINTLDVYVQWANSEGFGLPMVEAAGCGIPVIATDYSAMADVVRKVNGFPIKPIGYYYEPETGCKRAVPDNEELIKKLLELYKMTPAQRQRLGFKARMGVEKHYKWEYTVDTWMGVIDNAPFSEKWSEPAKLVNPNQKIPDNLNNEQFVYWCLVNIAGRPDLINSYISLRMVRDLNWGGSLGHFGGLHFNDMSTLGLMERFTPFNRQNVIDTCVAYAQKNNHYESLRTGVNNADSATW